MGHPHSRHTLRASTLARLRERMPNIGMDVILEWYQNYRKVSHNRSSLKKDEFREVFCHIFQENASEFADHIFRVFDENQDGHVDFEEFLVGLSMTEPSLQGSGMDAHIQQIEWAFRVYDVDNSGTISRNDMRNIIHSVYHLTSIHQEWETPEEFADYMFERIHHTEEGEIPMEEFLAAARQDETLLKLLMPSMVPHNVL